ncbi:MAG: branched-chain amino acid ABC transporter substrate-binding protein [Anaerolineae bacterium]|nr:branched-chain amino acid ABC transporter substrate-binding protein [Anaerolineae bacterium]
MRSLKSISFMLLIALLVIAITPVGAQDDEGVVVIAPGDTIKIALVTDLTGPIAPMGLDIQQAGELAVMEFNEAGGVEGFEVELVIEDDRCSSDEGTTVANRVASNPEVVAVAGHSCSGPTIAASEIYEEARIPMMSPSATNATLTARGFEVVNRVAFSDKAQGTVDAHYMYKILGVRKIAVIHDNEAYGLGLGEVVRDVFTELGGEVVAFEGISTEDTDYRPVLTPLVVDAPEVVFFGGYQEQTILLVTQSADVGLDTIWFSDDGSYAKAFIDGAGEAAEGAYASFAETPPANIEANEAFDAKYEELFGVAPDEQGPFHAQSYDATMILMNAIAEVAVVDDEGNLVIDREALVAAVRGTADYDGLTGLLTCDESGDCGVGRIVVNIVEDGEWVPVDVPQDLLEMEAE